MKEKIFRVLALLLAIGIVWAEYFVSTGDQNTTFQTIGNFVVCVIFFSYAVGGQKLLNNISMFRGNSKK